MAVLLVNVLLYSSLVLVVLGTCRPFEKNWQFWLPGYCVNKQARDFVAASLNLVTDVFILILPQRVIWKLQMTRRRRIGVSVVFSVGLLYVFVPFPSQSLLQMRETTDRHVLTGSLPSQLVVCTTPSHWTTRLYLPSHLTRHTSSHTHSSGRCVSRLACFSCFASPLFPNSLWRTVSQPAFSDHGAPGPVLLHPFPPSRRTRPSALTTTLSPTCRTMLRISTRTV